MRSNETAPAIAVVGSTMIDLIAYTSRVPAAGETIVGESFQMGFGGKGANQAVMARLLGAEVAMINSLGDDSYGDMTMENFAGYGIDTSQVARVPGSSGVAPIWVEPDGGNRIIIVPGANEAMTPAQALLAVNDLSRIDVAIGQLEIPQDVTAAGFVAAKQRGAVTVLNPAPAAELNADLVAAADWIIPNEIEFGMLSGSASANDGALNRYAQQTGCRLLVTLGEEGSALVTATGSVVRIGSDAVAAVDSTGAGDAFVGGFSYGLAAGLDERDAILLGTRCAADSVTRPGTQSSFPSPERAVDILSTLRT